MSIDLFLAAVAVVFTGLAAYLHLYLRRRHELAHLKGWKHPVDE